MKKIFSISIILLAVLLLLPLASLKSQGESQPIQTIAPTEPEKEKNDCFKVLISESGKIENISVEDYLFGVVAGEMPALYEAESLKAQAVCAYTFALWRQRENSEKEYDISDDYRTDQCYVSVNDARQKWGKNADLYEQKIRAAIKDVQGQHLTYQGELILAVYHSVSSGKTESAKNVWGKDYPYLQSVSSAGDKLATNYISTASFSASRIESALSVTLPEGLKGSFLSFSRTEAGTVKSVNVGGKKFTGAEIRKALNLKSSNFKVALKNDEFTFTVYGYGHGVGMSQNGANYMAQQGSDYKEILNHYYTGCEISQ